MTFHAALDTEPAPESARLPVALLYTGTHEAQEHSRQLDTINRCRHAKKLEEAAALLRNEAVELIRTTSCACATATSRMENAMQSNIEELMHMVSRLQHAIARQQAVAGRATDTLCGTAGSLASHDGPFN